MGKRNRKRGRDAKEGDRDGRGSWVDTTVAESFINESFERYYKGAVIPKEEWEACHKAFVCGLPSCLRFNLALASPVRHHVMQLLIKEFNEAGIEPQMHHFMEDSSAFQVPLSRGELKRHIANKRAKKLATALNDTGYLSRQETVSMIPAIFLDVQPGNRVLDMCAAPGSKTAQLLEHLVRGQADKADGPGVGGIVVANDVNASRLDILNHQTGRLPQAQSRLVITKHDATRFPYVPEGAERFDRVLCDVMCSGDGTLRKSIDLWKRWNATDGAALHQSQSAVLQRGMSVCKKGGMVVYSTCTLNPLEDEAVVFRCLKESKGAFELLPVADMFPALKRYEGLHSWRVMSRDAVEEYSSVEDAKSKSAKFQKYCPSLWCPSPEEAKAAHLERCMRVAPHLQDTGGFFVAALRCLEEMGPSSRPSATATATADSSAGAMQPLTDDFIGKIKSIVGFQPSDEFPFHNVFSRGEDARQPKMYYCTEDAKRLLSEMPNLMVQQAGEKIFECRGKNDLSSLRFCSEGIGALNRLLPPRFKRHVLFEKIRPLLGTSEGRMMFSAFQNLLVDSEQGAGKPPSQFLTICDVPNLGQMVFPCSKTEIGNSGSDPVCWVKVRISPGHAVLLGHALGDPLIPEGEGDDEKEAKMGEESDKDGEEGAVVGEAE